MLSYAYHCCEFMPLMEGEPEVAEEEGLSDFVLVPPQRVDLAAWANVTDIWTHYRQFSHFINKKLSIVITFLISLK